MSCLNPTEPVRSAIPRSADRALRNACSQTLLTQRNGLHYLPCHRPGSCYRLRRWRRSTQTSSPDSERNGGKKCARKGVFPSPLRIVMCRVLLDSSQAQPPQKTFSTLHLLHSVALSLPQFRLILSCPRHRLRGLRQICLLRHTARRLAGRSRCTDVPYNASSRADWTKRSSSTVLHFD